MTSYLYIINAAETEKEHTDTETRW